MNERLVTEKDEAKSKKFYDPLPKSNVKTMSEMNKTVKRNLPLTVGSELNKASTLAESSII